MKKITVSVDDETYRRVRMKAAEQDTSVSELVRRLLSELTADVGVTERPAREERALRARIRAFSAANRLAREDVHWRGA
jgi:predicted CopG family antitoxin